MQIDSNWRNDKLFQRHSSKLILHRNKTSVTFIVSTLCHVQLAMHKLFPICPDGDIILSCFHSSLFTNLNKDTCSFTVENTSLTSSRYLDMFLVRVYQYLTFHHGKGCFWKVQAPNFSWQISPKALFQPQDLLIPVGSGNILIYLSLTDCLKVKLFHPLSPDAV